MRQPFYAVLAISLSILVGVSVTGCGFATPPAQTQVPSATPGSSSGSMSVPMLDAWWDSSAAGLRIEYGVAGAASQGRRPIYNDGPYSGAAACVRKGIVLLTTTFGSISLAKLPQGAPQLIEGQSIQNAQIAFSPSCVVALAYASGNSSALLIQGLLTAPKSSAVALPANTSAVAVADSGSILISVLRTDGSAALQLMTTGSAVFQPVIALSKFGGMTFVPGSDTAIIADAGNNSLTRASGLGGNMSMVQVAGTSDGISHPVAVGVSADGHTAAVANGTGSAIVRIDLSRQLPAAQATCQCSPAELKPIGSNAGFRLNEPGLGTVWAFDADSAKPRIVFLPSAPAAVTALGGQR